MKKILLFVLLAMMIAGCARSRSNSNEAAASPESSANYAVPASKKLIKTAELSFSTEDIQLTSSLITNSLQKYGAYKSEETTNTYNDKTGTRMEVRVPVRNFDAFIDHIARNSGVKELKCKSTKVRDVTEEYIDVETRTILKKESEQKLLLLMKQAKNLTETLAIQKQLAELQEDVEASEGRLKYLSKQVEYSTVTITFYEKKSISTHFFGELWSALSGGIQVFLYLIKAIAYLWVVILVSFLIWFGWRRYKNRDSE